MLNMSYTRYAPRNSTQVISISSVSPSAESGTSPKRLRRTYGPVSVEARDSDVELVISSIFEEDALESWAYHGRCDGEVEVDGRAERNTSTEG